MKVMRTIVIQKMGREYIAYDTATSTMHELNETAYFILTRIQKKQTERAITDALALTYAITPKRAEDDFRDLITELFEKKILEK